MTPLAFTKLCEIEDFAHPDLLPVCREMFSHKAGLAPGFPKGAEHRKDWEVAMAVRALRSFGALRPDAEILGVAAGMEDTLFYLTRHVRRVFAMDRYYDSGPWSPIAPATMLVSPEVVAPFDFDPRRLVVQHMDGRLLNYPDASFDGVFSSGSIEHFGTFDDVAQSVYEMARVLKPGGVLSLSTEFRLHGPPGGIGWPGQTLLFSAEHIQRYIVEASGLELVGELSPDVSDLTLAAPRDLTETVLTDMAARQAGAPSWAVSALPHLVLMHEGNLFTSVHVTLRKPEHPQPAANGWARPTEETIRAVRDYNGSLLARPTEAPAAPSPSLTATAPGVGVPANGSAAGAEAGVPALGTETWLAAAGTVLRTRREALAAWPSLVDANLLEVERAEEAAARHLRRIVHLQHDAPRWTSDPGRSEILERAMVPGGAPEPAWVQASWSTHLVEVSGVRFAVVVDPTVDDPVARALAAGRSVDEAHLSLMLQATRAGDRIVDLGAHVGTFTLTAAAAGRTVLAVEAAPSNAALLRRSVLANRFDAVRIVHAAVGTTTGTVEFVDYGPWGHVATGEPEPTVSVPAVRVDDLLAELEWSQVAFVKLDVEGSEIPTLAGMRTILEGPDAPLLFFESNGHTLAAAGATPADLLGLLQGLGYAMFLVDAGRLVRTRPHEFQPQCIVDYLAVKDDRIALDGWRVEDGMSLGERVRRIERDSRLGNPYHRAYLARALARADEVILGHLRVQAVLADLRADDAPSIREEAAWSGGKAR